MDGPVRQETPGQPQQKDGKMHTMPCLHALTQRVQKWMEAFMKNVKAPAMARYTFMWMLHGDVGEDNTTAISS